MIRNKFGRFALTVGLLALVFVIASLKIAWVKRGHLAITFLDVGQGDSILIEVPTGERVLIDGGPDDSVLTELSLVTGYVNSKIDYVFVTHSDSDHFGGIFYVAEKYEDVQYRLNLAEEKQNALERAWSYGGEPFISGDELVLGGVEFEALWPTELVRDGSAKDSNDRSIVLKVSYKSFCGIFTGDASSKVEAELVSGHGESLDCQLLKVSHHGSASASSEEFLEEVSPDVAVISVGKENSYGHPSEEVLERLKGVGAVVFRTDKQGRVQIWTDGESVFW